LFSPSGDAAAVGSDVGKGARINEAAGNLTDFLVRG